MNIKPAIFLLAFVSLFYIGCQGPNANQPSPNQSNSVAGPDVSASSPTQSSESLPNLLPITGTGTLGGAHSDLNKFSFVVFGDNRGGGEVTQKMFGEIAAQKPAFAFGLGDIVNGELANPELPESKTKMETEYKNFLGVVKSLAVPVFNAPGNHEMVQNTGTYESPNKYMHEYYEQNINAPFYGSFDYGNSHFIALNTSDLITEEEINAGKCPPMPPPNSGSFAECSYLGQAQLQQLDNDLAANKDKTHIFIMMHYPMMPQNPTDGLYSVSLSNLKDILKKYKNISYILASHEHLFYNPQEPDNVDTIAPFTEGGPTGYLVSGGAGAPMYCDSGKYAFDHYLMFEVDGKNINVEIKRAKDQQPCKQ